MAERSAAEPAPTKRKRGKGRPFEPGHSGNPGGMRPGVGEAIREIRQGLLEFRAEAVKQLRSFIEGNADPETCLEALKLYFKHVLPSQKELPEEDPVSAMSDEELEKRLREVMAKRHPTTKVTQ